MYQHLWNIVKATPAVGLSLLSAQVASAIPDTKIESINIASITQETLLAQAAPGICTS